MTTLILYVTNAAQISQGLIISPFLLPSESWTNPSEPSCNDWFEEYGNCREQRTCEQKSVDQNGDIRVPSSPQAVISGSRKEPDKDQGDKGNRQTPE
jgi:hypothetical protein